MDGQRRILYSPDHLPDLAQLFLLIHFEFGEKNHREISGGGEAFS
jgi:hypothetical protein